MPLQYSQFIWGFEVFDSGDDQNNKIDFLRPPSTGATFSGSATLEAGVYTADELAKALQEAMNEADDASGGNDYVVTFDYETRKFTFEADNSFDISFGAADTCNKLLGFSAATKTYTDPTPLESDTAVGAPDVPAEPGVPYAWAMTEPLLYNSPARVAELTPTMGSTTGTQRAIATVQNVSDGGAVESIHFSTVRLVRMQFRALPDADVPRMERFLDWISTGKRFTWQPDKTDTKGMKLVLSNPGTIGTAYEWLTRPEVGYGTLTFIEQLS